MNKNNKVINLFRKMVMSSLVDFIILIGNIMMIIFLIIVLVYSLKYFGATFPLVEGFNARMFSIGMIIAIVTIIGQWTEGRIKSIIKLMEGNK